MQNFVWFVFRKFCQVGNSEYVLDEMYRISPSISREIYPRTKYYTDNSSYTRVTPSGKKLCQKQVEFSKFGRNMTEQWWAIMHELMNIRLVQEKIMFLYSALFWCRILSDLFFENLLSLPKVTGYNFTGPHLINWESAVFVFDLMFQDYARLM